MEFQLGQKVYYSPEAIKEQPTECWQGMLDATPKIVGMSFNDYDPTNPVNYALSDNGEITDGYGEKHLSTVPTIAEQLTTYL